MGLFKSGPKLSADGYERKTVQGYADKGKVAKMLADGWEIESSQPVIISGNSIRQERFTLRRRP